MSLFDLFKKKKPVTQADIQRYLYENDADYRKVKDENDRQQRLLDRYWSAVNEYKKSGNIMPLIVECEHLFIEEDPPCRTSQQIKLADYYMKAGMNDKAWSYLNYLYQRDMAGHFEVRNNQARILRKEKNYSEAIRYFMMAYLEKAKQQGLFKKDQFLKAISSCANRLNLSDDQREYLAYIIDHQIKDGSYSLTRLSNAYKEFCREIKSPPGESGRGKENKK